MIKKLAFLTSDRRPLVRFAVLLCAAALLTLIFWFGALMPISVMTLAPEQQAVIDQKRSEMIAAKRSLIETTNNLTPTDRRNLLAEITKKTLGEAASMDDSGMNYAVISIAAVPASTMLSWLSGLETDVGIAPDEVDIQRADSTDSWNGIFRFPLLSRGNGT
jgi:type II secretory pathway component PulM